MSEIILHDYWRSSASYRVRIALNLKGVAYRRVSHDLLAGAQRDPDFLARAPHGLVPALEHDGTVLIESPAILEWIEARWPDPPLLPADIDAAATVRAMAALICCDIHPLNNLRVLKRLRGVFDASREQVDDWIAAWIGEGFAALETMARVFEGPFACGATPTLADCCLVPQMYNARRYHVDLKPYPRLLAIEAAAAGHPAFAAAHPDTQPEAPG